MAEHREKRGRHAGPMEVAGMRAVRPVMVALPAGWWRKAVGPSWGRREHINGGGRLGAAAVDGLGCCATELR